LFGHLKITIVAIGITQFAFVGMLQAENTGNLGPPSSLELDPTVGHISLYGKRDWEGSTFKLDQPGAIANLRSVNFNNRTTSIGGRGFGSIWELCEKPAYAGWCLWIGSGEATRRVGALNDKVSSLRWLSNEALREIRVILYRDRNSDRPGIRRAESALNAFRSGSRRLAGQGSAQINNEASAVEIRSGSWEFCKDRDFAGGCIVLGPGSHDLHALGFGDKVTSFRVLNP
jgi:hypothetical protein